MTKKEVFPLYLGRCKVKFKWLNGTYGIEMFQGIDIDKDRIATEIYDNLSISDCQLILKRISGMSNTEKFNFAQVEVMTLSDCNGFYTPKQFLWLIKNGYAISDELFDLGIAVEQAEEKK